MKPPWQADDGSTQEAVDAREPISPLNFNIHTIKLITRRATRHVLPISKLKSPTDQASRPVRRTCPAAVQFS